VRGFLRGRAEGQFFDRQAKKNAFATFNRETNRMRISQLSVALLVGTFVPLSALAEDATPQPSTLTPGQPVAPAGLLTEPGDYKYEEPSGTFSIVALDPTTGELGVAVQSNTIAVGARTRWGKGGVAAIASQASSNPMFGEIGVTLLERGFTPEEARDMMIGMDSGALNRQFAIIDIDGNTAAWTSPDITDWKGHHCGENYCAQGNTLAGPDVVLDMAAAFEAAEGPLAARLLTALEAAEAAGGDRRGTQSAGLLILEPRSVADYGDRALDLRVDESLAPIPELRRIYNAAIAGQAASGLANLIQEGKFDEALERINASLALDPLRDAAYLQMADVYLAMNDVPAAVQALGKAVELNPKAYYQILRDEDFAPIHANADFLAMGDFSRFAPLAPSAPEGI
jgi:uncharacterized Ntn-hydrolase superfamily protein